MSSTKRKNFYLSSSTSSREIIVYNNSVNESKRMISDGFRQKFGVRIGRTTIHDIIANSEKLFEMENIRGIGVKRLRNDEHIHLENALFMWFYEVRHNQCPLSDEILLEKAKDFGEMVGVESAFQYSNGWPSKFKARYNIKLKIMHGESASVDKFIVNEGRAELKLLTRRY